MALCTANLQLLRQMTAPAARFFIGWPSMDCGKCRHADCTVAGFCLISGAAGWMQEGRAWCGVRCRTGKCTAVRCPMQRAALAGAARCVGRCSALRGAVHRAAGWRPLTCWLGDDSPVWRRDGAWAGFAVLWKGCAEGTPGAFVPLCPSGSGQAAEPAHSPLCQGRKAKAGTAGVLSPPWYMVVWGEACALGLIRLQA